MADLRTSLCGIELEHPLVLASGPLSWNGAAIAAAARAGAAAVVTKTISCQAARSPRPHLAALGGGVLNAELGSDLAPERWLDRELPRAREAGATIIVSLGLSVSDIERLAVAFERAGADALEVVSYNAAALPAMVRAAVARVQIPVLAKLSANDRDLVSTATACAAAGASGLTAIDSLGPALRIDLVRRRPRLAGAAAWWSGPAILPLALAAVHRLHRAVSLPMVGTGGVDDADAAIEMLIAGACAVGLCSAPLAHGVGLFARLRDRMAQRLDALGLESVRAAVGSLRDREDRVQAFHLDAARCTECGACVRVCPYVARRSSRDVSAECRTCGLCVSVCPTGALDWEGSEP